MNRSILLNRSLRFGVLALLVGLAACGGVPKGGREQECLARAMYFESNRSSDEGMLAVGTVVMNRLESGKYPTSICGVVGQKKQFAPGVLSKPMGEGNSRERAMRTAGEVMRGKRHRAVGNAMFFHTAGYNFPYTNMHYKVIAGGNAFYEKRSAKGGRRNTTQAEISGKSRLPRPQPERRFAAARPAEPAPVRVAQAWTPPLAPPTAHVPAAAQPVGYAPQNIEELLLLEGAL